MSYHVIGNPFAPEYNLTTSTSTSSRRSSSISPQRPQSDVLPWQPVYYSTYTTSTSDTNSLYYLVVSCHIDNRTSYHHGNNPPLTVLLLVILARHHISLYFCATLAIERLTLATCLQFTVLVLIEQTSLPGTIVFGRISWHSITILLLRNMTW